MSFLSDVVSWLLAGFLAFPTTKATFCWINQHRLQIGKISIVHVDLFKLWEIRFNTKSARISPFVSCPSVRDLYRSSYSDQPVEPPHHARSAWALPFYGKLCILTKSHTWIVNSIFFPILCFARLDNSGLYGSCRVIGIMCSLLTFPTSWLFTVSISNVTIHDTIVYRDTFDHGMIHGKLSLCIVSSRYIVQLCLKYEHSRRIINSSANTPNQWT